MQSSPQPNTTVPMTDPNKAQPPAWPADRCRKKALADKAKVESEFQREVLKHLAGGEAAVASPSCRLRNPNLKSQPEESTMPPSPNKTAPNPSAEHHTKAAEYCDKAAEQHRHAAKSCTPATTRRPPATRKTPRNHCSKLRITASNEGGVKPDSDVTAKTANEICRAVANTPLLSAMSWDELTIWAATATRTDISAIRPLRSSFCAVKCSFRKKPRMPRANMARFTMHNAKYMLWSVAALTISTILQAVAMLMPTVLRMRGFLFLVSLF